MFGQYAALPEVSRLVDSTYRHMQQQPQAVQQQVLRELRLQRLNDAKQLQALDQELRQMNTLPAQAQDLGRKAQGSHRGNTKRC